MIRTALYAAVFASAAFAAGCGDDSMMVMPDVDGGTTPPPTPPPTPVPTPVPPPPMDAGPGTVCTPTADNPLCIGAGSCQCDNSGLNRLISAYPDLESMRPSLEGMSTCAPGNNACGWDLPSSMSYTPGFACAESVNNDLWVVGGDPTVMQGKSDYEGENGQFIIPSMGACMDHTCYGNWRLKDMSGDLGVHLLTVFAIDCQSFTTDYYPAGDSTPIEEYRLGGARVEDCSDGIGDCP